MAATAQSIMSSHMVFKAENRGFPFIKEERTFPEALADISLTSTGSQRLRLSYKGWENKSLI